MAQYPASPGSPLVVCDGVQRYSYCLHRAGADVRQDSRRIWRLSDLVKLGGVHAPPSGNMGLLATPYMVSFDFLSIVMALGYDLVSEAVNAGCYSHQHQVIN